MSKNPGCLIGLTNSENLVIFKFLYRILMKFFERKDLTRQF